MSETKCGVNRGFKDFHVSFVNQYPFLCAKETPKKAGANKLLDETTGVVSDIKRRHGSLSTH